MELIKIDDKEKKQELKKQCRFIDDELDTDVYALFDNGDPKTVFTLKRIGDYTQPISTIRQLDFETRQDAQGHGYATIGFEEMLEVIQERTDLSEVYIDAANPISGKIAERFGLESTEIGRYVIQNPNFDINYETVCEMIKRGVPEEQIRTFTTENGLNFAQIETWLAVQRDLPQIETSDYEVPIFAPPVDNNLNNQPTSKDSDLDQINELGEIPSIIWRKKECRDFDIYYTRFDSSVLFVDSGIKLGETAIGKQFGGLRFASLDERKTQSVIEIIMANEDEIMGAVEVKILEDNNALIDVKVASSKKIDLPRNLSKKSIDEFDSHQEAFFVGEKYRKRRVR